MDSYQIGKPEHSEERTRAEVEEQLPAHVLAVLRESESMDATPEAEPSA